MLHGNNTAVVIEGSWAHGPSHDTEYDLATGKLIAHVTDDGKDLPAWAKGLGR